MSKTEANDKFDVYNKLYNKLYKVQKEIGVISKDKINPFYKSTYFDINKLIEQVIPILKSHKLLLLQPIEDGKQYSRIIDLDGGMVESSLALPTDLDSQRIGGAITYYRRYTLVALLGLQAEDDDGNTAVPKDNNQVNSDDAGF